LRRKRKKYSRIKKGHKAKERRKRRGIVRKGSREGKRKKSVNTISVFGTEVDRENTFQR